MSDPDHPQRGLLPTLGWACYLGSSWTWVIGMFFPILLLRDFGLWGWIVFAIPNVIGAAAMGWVLSPRLSHRLVEDHRHALVLFTAVTCMFQLAVVAFVVSSLLAFAVLAFLAVYLLIILALIRRARSEWVVAAVVTLVSLLAFGYWLFQGTAWLGVGWATARTPRLEPIDLWLFAPASLTGFMLCPYLDVTFHRARMRTSLWTGRIAFAVGFGVIFLLMIVFSLAYAGELVWLFELDAWSISWLPGAWMPILATHMIVQAAFTVAVHVHALSARPAAAQARSSGATIVLIVVIACLPLLAMPLPLGDISAVERMYRTYLLFYGLVFPAYVFLCMIPTWRSISNGKRRKRVVFVVATVAALPMGFAGFVMGLSWWMPASLGVLVAARGALEIMAWAERPSPSAGPGA